MELMNRKLSNKMADKNDLEDIREKVIEIINKTKSIKQHNKKIINAISTTNPHLGLNGKKVHRRMS